jgi:hypothetical protein
MFLAPYETHLYTVDRTPSGVLLKQVVNVPTAVLGRFNEVWVVRDKGIQY